MKRHLWGCQSCGDPIPLSTATKNRGYCDGCAKPEPEPAPRPVEDAQHYADVNGWRVA